jgi:regulator of protease activity HflC (stomatin/prohibitin superfamily)
MEAVAVIVALAFILLVALLLFFATVKIVNQYERILVFTLGRTSPDEVKGPGWVLIVPIVQRGIRVDLREQFIEVPSQTSITKDNAPISIDFLIYWRIVEPYKSVVEVQNFNGALQNIATTTLRAVVGDILLDDVLSKREQINEVLRLKMDEVTSRWGGKVTTVEIREITPPRDVQDAMNRQLSAERTRRAVITESEGNRQSAINVAEGAKQSEILRAEGDRQAAILRAEGFGLAIERIFTSASKVDQKTMALQYLETLKSIGASPSTKYVLPLEVTQLGEAFRGYLQASNEPGPSGTVGGGAVVADAPAAGGGSAATEPPPSPSPAPTTGLEPAG